MMMSSTASQASKFDLKGFLTEQMRAMKRREFESVVDSFEAVEKEDSDDFGKRSLLESYEGNIIIAKAKYEMNDIAESRDCYRRAVEIDRERAQGHKGICESGFVRTDCADADAKFLREYAIKSAEFLLLSKEIGDGNEECETRKFALKEKICDGLARIGEFSKAAKAFGDLGGGKFSIVACKYAMLSAYDNANKEAEKKIEEAKGRTIVSKKDEVRIAREATIESFANEDSFRLYLKFLNEYFVQTSNTMNTAEENAIVDVDDDDLRRIETFAIKLARAKIDFEARQKQQVQQNNSSSSRDDALKFALETFKRSFESLSTRFNSTSGSSSKDEVLALGLEIIAFSESYLGPEEEGLDSNWKIKIEYDDEEYLYRSIKSIQVNKGSATLACLCEATLDHIHKKRGRGYFHNSCIGNDIECHHEGTRVESGSRDSEICVKLLEAVQISETTIEERIADGIKMNSSIVFEDEIMSTRTFSTLLLVMVSMIRAESRAFRGDALGTIELAQHESILSVTSLSETQKRAKLLLAESYAKLGRTFDYASLVETSPARGARIRAYYVATASVDEDAKEQKLKWLKRACKAAPNSRRCAFELAWTQDDIDKCESILYLEEENNPGDVLARWASRRAVLTFSCGDTNLELLQNRSSEHSIFSRAALAAKLSSDANPYRALAFSALSLCCDASGDLVRAKALREKALKIDPSDEISGPREASTTQIDKCREVCQNAIKWNPNCMWAAERLANDENAEVSLSALRILVRGKEASVSIWTRLGDCYRKLDRKSAALDAFEHAVALFQQMNEKNDDAASRDDAMYAATVSGSVSLQLGSLERSESLFKTAFKIHSESKRANSVSSSILPILIGLARCCLLDASRSLMRGAQERSRRSAEECISYSSNALETILLGNRHEKKYVVVERVARTLLGDAYLLTGSINLAIQEFSKCVELFPDLASTRENLARALLLDGSTESIEKTQSACIEHANVETVDSSSAWRALAKLPKLKEESDESYFGRVEMCLSRAVSLCVSHNATIWSSLAQLYVIAANVRRRNNEEEDKINELERAASTCLDKARTLNPHEGIAWIHTGENILSEGILDNENDKDESKEGGDFFDKAAKAFDVATTCAFEDASHARIADAKFAAIAAASLVAVSEDEQRSSNAHRYMNVAVALRATRARKNDPVAYWSLGVVCERRMLVDMAKDAYENALRLLLERTTELDFTFGNGEDEVCREAVSSACREGLERLEKRKTLKAAGTLHSEINITAETEEPSANENFQEPSLSMLLNQGDLRNKKLVETCLNRLRFAPSASPVPSSSTSFNLADEKMLRELAKTDVEGEENSTSIGTITSARLALAAKLIKIDDKDKQEEANKYATRVSETNDIDGIKISESIVRASKLFLEENSYRLD